MTRNLFAHLLVGASFLVWFTGCETTTHTLYLQDVRLKGPLSDPPVHITRDNTERPFRVTPHFSFNANSQRTVSGKIENHTMVDANGVYQVDTIRNADNTVSFRERDGANIYGYEGKNLTWSLPDATVGLDIDYTVSKHVALSFGAKYSSTGRRGLWGYMVGLGVYSEDSTAAIRLDGGVQWQALLYEAATVVVTTTSGSSARAVGFFLDRGSSLPADFFVSFTFNSKRKEWLANYFAQLAISKQSLASFKPTAVAPFDPYPPLYTPVTFVHDQRADFSSTVFTVTPGVYLDLSPSSRIVIGVRVRVQTEIEGSDPQVIASPLLQFEYGM